MIDTGPERDISPTGADPRVQFAHLHLTQGRFADAEREVRGLLVEAPSNADLLCLLAAALAPQDDGGSAGAQKLREASEAVEAAVGLQPDWPHVHDLRARVLLARSRYAEAELSARQAVALDPEDAEARGTLSAALLGQKSWTSALAEADAGLAIDPRHDRCRNLRASALVQLGRRAEAEATLRNALADRPDDADTHANQGWQLLHSGDPKQAMVHFREALRLEPGHEWARAGMVEALKARNPIYRMMLAYFLWMSRLSDKAQWIVIIGLFVGVRVLRGLADANPSLAPFVWPIIILYSAFAIMTWLAGPLFNLMLRLHPFGRHALSPDQRTQGTIVGLELLTALVLLVLWPITDDWRFGAAAVGPALLMIPTSGTFSIFGQPQRWAMAGLTIALGVIGLAATVALFVASQDAEPTAFWMLAGLFLLGVFLSQWVAIGLSMRTNVR